MILYEILSDVSPQWNLYNYRQMYMYAYATSSPNHKILILLCWITTEVLEWQFIGHICTDVYSSKQKQSKSPCDLWLHWHFIPVQQ